MSEDKPDVEEYHHVSHPGDVLSELNRQRFSAQHLCDATLRTGNGTGTVRMKAHRSVLSACSEYFRTLFTSKLAASPSLRAGIVHVDLEPRILKTILNFIYTGKLQLCMEDAQDLLSAADFLCMDSVKQYCARFLRSRITVENCICVKFLAEKYNLDELAQDALAVATTSTLAVFQTQDALEFPFEYVISLLKDPLLNYINEGCLYRFLINWVNVDFPSRSKCFRLLYACLHPGYLPRDFLRERATTEPLLTPEFLEPEQYSAIFLDETPAEARNSEDVILCRSRSVSQGDQVCVLCYHIHQDRWSRLRLPATHALDGLESMVYHNGALYFLVARMEDMFGYMHSTPETKHFWRLELRTGSWETLPAPGHVKGTCRLVSHVNGVYVIDRSGQVEEFDADQSKWTLTASAMFDSSTPTLYVLPMPMDRYMYILRAFSSGYSFEYSSHSFSLHRLDTVHGSHRKLSQIEASDLELVENEHMFGYSIKPGQFTLTNELGRPRVVYNLVEQSWTTSATPTKPPAFIGEVWGSVPWQDRVYFVGRTKSDAPIFMFYDVTRERFKATVAPPSHLSGVICHMVADRTQLSQNLMT